MFQSKIVISLLIVLFFVGGLGAGFALFKALNVSDLLSPQRAENKRYLRDELILTGKDASGKQFFTRLTFSRKQTSFGNYLHFYSFATKRDTTSSEVTFSKETQSDLLVSGTIVTNIVVKPATDLSTRESYMLTLQISGIPYEITTTQFEGDYILKNSIDDTKYLSVGKATVSTQNKKWEVNALLIKTYAEDYSRSIFFNGYGQTDATKQLFAFWDTSNNFYYLEHIDTQTVQPKLTPYMLALNKTSASEMTKLYSAIITPNSNDTKLPSKWDITINNLKSARVSLDVNYYNSSSGTATGNISDSDGVRAIHGYSFYGGYFDE